jgi:hypothetical protein
MLWIREEEVFTRFDYGSVEQRSREHDLYGLCGDVRREDPEAPSRLFITIFAWLCNWKWLGCLWMGLRNIWQLETPKSLATG